MAGAAQFAEHVSSTFVVDHAEPAAVAFELVSVTDHSNPHVVQFSLLFRAAARPALAQGLYSMRHALLGDLHLFIVPVQETADGRYYEAIFSRPAASRASG